MFYDGHKISLRDPEENLSLDPVQVPPIRNSYCIQLQLL